MDTAYYANKKCPKCHGLGVVITGEHLSNRALCHCAIANKRMEDAERVISTRFPERAQFMTLDEYDTGGDPKNEQALTAARNFVDNYQQASREGWLLGFWGLPSSGKTHLTTGIGMACVRRYLAKPAYFNVPTELRRERERFRDQSRQHYQSSGRTASPPTVSPIDSAIYAELLILDDLGAEYHRQGADSGDVSWVYEQLYTILEERIMGCRATLFTSNFSPSDLARRMGNESGKRVLSRIERAQASPALEVVEVPGANRQSDAAAQKLFSVRTAKDYELHNQTTGQRNRYDREGLIDLIQRFRARHGDDVTRSALIITRVQRDGQAVRETVDLDKVLSRLDDRERGAGDAVVSG